MINETLGKENFQSLIKQVYQQTVSLSSLERQSERLSFLRSVKNFESSYVYNWQRFLYPILNGPEKSPYRKYTGLRSAPWAEYDVLDPTHGGISGWTLTAEPWATESGLPCLWDGTKGQPNSITGALYCLSSRIDAIISQDFEIDPYDDSELRSLIQCNDLNIRTLYKDIYACDLEPNCSGNEKLQYSFQRHFYEIFSQIILGGPDLSGDFSCEDAYPNLFLNISTCDIAWDPNCPLVEISAGSITGGVTIKLENNGVAYDNVEMIGTGDTTVSYNSTTNQIEVNSTGGGSTYSFTSSTQSANTALLNLSDSFGNVDTVSLTAGSGVLISETSNIVTVEAESYSNKVNTVANGVELDLERSGIKVDGTKITGLGSVTVSKVNDSEFSIEAGNSLIGAVDSKSILGQNAISPIRAIDFYAQTLEPECCYEYNYNVNVPAVVDRVLQVGSGSPINTGVSACIGGKIQTANEYVLDAASLTGRGMSLSFWLNKQYADWIGGESGKQVIFCIHDANNAVEFELILDYPKNHVLDPEHSNVTISQGEEMNEHLVMYVKTSSGFLYRLIDITEEGLELNWKHFSIVLDLEFTNSSAVSLYLDGSLYSNPSSGILSTGSAPGIANQDSYSLFAFPVSPCRDFKGAIEDFVIYSEELTSNEALTIFGEREYKDIFGSNTWVNNKVAEWWQLGEDPVFDAGGYQVGDAIASQLTITSRVNGETIDGVLRVGTPITFTTQFTKFEIASHQYSAASQVLAGTPVKATGSIEITEAGFNNPGWIVNLRRVIDDITTFNTSHEIVQYESTSNASLDGTQDPNSYRYYFFIGVDKEETAINLGSAIAASGFTNDFNPIVNQATVSLEARDFGERFNTVIASNGSALGYVTLNGFSGGVASTQDCLPAAGPGRAEGSVSFKADFGNGFLGSGTKVTLISTDGTQITYRSESTSAGLFGNGDIDSGEVIFLNGDDITDPNANFQTEYRYQAMIANFANAIESANGHNAGTPNSKFIIFNTVQKTTYISYLTQTIEGLAGNTQITTVHAAPNPSGLLSANNFSGGSDSLGGVPSNLEEYAQEAFLNRWDCTSQTIDLTPGKRYEIQLSGYNMFKEQQGTNCYDSTLDITGNLEKMLVDIFGHVSSAFRPNMTLNGDLNYSFNSVEGLDIAGISLVLRPENACVEDPRNIYLTPEYEKVADYLKEQYFEGSVDPYEQSLGGLNKSFKSSVLGKNSFRNFFSKWKAKIILTVGKSSINSDDKVNIYFKGEGVEFDLFEYSKRIGQSMGSTFENLSQLEKDHSTTLVGSGGLSRSRFDFEFTNPFRHRYYINGPGVLQYGLEDFNNKLKSNVIENVPRVGSTSASMVLGSHYYVQGTVATVTTPSNVTVPLQAGDSGWFADVISTEGGATHTGSADIAITLDEFPGLTFYMSALSAANHPISSSDIATLLYYYNAAFVSGTISYRLFALEACSVEAYNTLEVITWGIDSGRWTANLLGVAEGESDSQKNYFVPDGNIPVKVYLEEFTLKESQSEEICEFESINPFSSLDLGISGGLPQSGLCNYCPDWIVALAPSYSYYDENGSQISLTDPLGSYNGVSQVSGGTVVQRETGSCDFDYCSEEIVEASALTNTSNSGYGYLIQDVNSVESTFNSTMTVSSATSSWLPSDDHSSEMIVWLKEDTDINQVLDNVTGDTNLVDWTSQTNSLVFASGSGNVDTGGAENKPELVYASSGNRFISLDHTNHESISVDYDSVFDTFNPSSANGDGVGSIFMLVKLEQDNVIDPIGDEFNISTTDHTVSRLFSIGRGLQLRLHREKLVNNTWSTYLRFDNNSNSVDAGLTGAVGVNQVFLIEVVFGNGADASRRGIYVNGTKYSAQDIPQSTNFDWVNSPDMRIGRFPDWNSLNPSQTFDHSFSSFELGEFLLFDEELSETERQKIEGYLMHKFSINNSLPAGHPYLNSAPVV